MANPEERAREVKAATSSDWTARAGGHKLDKVKGNRKLTITKEPEFIYDKESNIVGVDAWVQLFNGNGKELPIDPHRRIVNPPTVPRSGVSVEETGEVDRFGRPIVSKILTPDPVAAFYEAVWDSVEGNPNEKGWRTRGTVTTVFSVNDNGLVSEAAVSGGQTYANARAGTASFSLSGNPASVGQVFFDFGGGDQFYDCVEQFVGFDTSSIADSDIVSQVVLDMYLTADNSTTDFTINARTKDWGASVTSADWVAGASLSGLTLLASLSTSGIGATGAYKTLTSQAAFLTAPNIKTGTVFAVLSSSRLESGTTPTGEEYVQFSTSSESGTTQDPKLTITHSAAAKGPMMFTSQPNRIWTVM